MPKIKSVSEKLIPKPAPYFRKTKNSNMDWEEVRCLACMEHPHKVVLLVCSSYDNNCRPYLCNSPVHDCLTQYRSESLSDQSMVLSCPLCRGHVSEERVIDRAVSYLDLKVKRCTYEHCEFEGTMLKLTRHWVKHSAGPSEEEVKRKKQWEKLERESSTSTNDNDLAERAVLFFEQRTRRPPTRTPRMSAAANFWRLHLPSGSRY